MYGVTESIGKAISNGEDRICKVILLEEGFPAWYLKECDESGHIPTAKVGGLMWKVGILATLEEGGQWSPASIEDIEIIEFQFMTPQRVYEKNVGLTHIIKVGKGKGQEVMFDEKGERIIVDTAMPSTFPAKDFETGVTADKIPVGQEKKYTKIIEDEQKRVRIWEVILRYWERLSEEAAANDNQMYMSRRLLLYADNGNGVKNYAIPEQGMVFTVKLKGKYNEPVAFEWSKKSDSFIYYSKGIEVIDVASAQNILGTTDTEERPF